MEVLEWSLSGIEISRLSVVDKRGRPLKVNQLVDVDYFELQIMASYNEKINEEIIGKSIYTATRIGLEDGAYGWRIGTFIEIEPDYRGKGFGTELLFMSDEYAITFLKRCGVSHVELHHQDKTGFFERILERYQEFLNSLKNKRVITAWRYQQDGDTFRFMITL